MLVKRFLVIALSFLGGIFLNILPLPDGVNWFRPGWVTLILCFWILQLPQYIGIGIAWCLGLCLDVLNGTVMGEHALALSLVAYFLLKIERQVRHYPPWQQGIFILALTLIYNSILFVIQWGLGQVISDWRFWVAPFVSMLMWPWIYAFLKSYQGRFRLI